jgi:hypothetical protein
MRALLVAVIGLVLVSGANLARADVKAIDKLVKSHLVELGKLSDDDALSLTKDAIVINERGTQVDLSERDGCVSGAVANSFYGCLQADIKHVPGKLTIGSDGDIGWFQGPFTVSITGEDPDGNAVKTKETHRVAGVAIKEGKDWKIAAIMYVAPIPDSQLFKARERAVPTQANVGGQKKIAAIIANGWFPGKFATNVSTKTPLIASGTSPAEFKTAAAATKLVQSWDKLKIQASQIDVKVLPGGAYAWVTAETKLPLKKDKTKAVAMKMVMLIHDDGDASGWRWVSIAYQPPFEIGG